jgi:lysophospholipase L1-like esterase
MTTSRRIVLGLLLATLAATGTPLLAEQTAARASGHKFAIPQTDEGLPGAGPIRRYKWFQNLWTQRRTQWALRVRQDQRAIVFLGDSITQGWGDTMANSFAGAKVANRGISGDTSRGMLIRLQDDVLALNPACVVMLMGTNDLEEKAEPLTIVGDVKLILAELKKHNAKMPVILCMIMPSSASKQRPADKIKEINGLLATAVKGDPQVTVVDTWTLFANEMGDATKPEFPDLLHPNKIGYAKCTAALRSIFATLGFLETEPDRFKLEAGFESLFNGHDLSGWGFQATTAAKIEAINRRRKRNPNGPARPIVKETVTFEGMQSSNDGRYVAKNGRLIVTTPTKGRRIQQLWATREFPNDFVLKLEFRATPNADSGIFIRQPQLQCRDFLLAGPYKELKKYKPQDWNEIVVTVTGGVAHCTCNGEVLEAEFKVPESGPIGLEGDRGQIEYRRIRVRTLD